MLFAIQVRSRSPILTRQDPLEFDGMVSNAMRYGSHDFIGRYLEPEDFASRPLNTRFGGLA